MVKFSILRVLEDPSQLDLNSHSISISFQGISSLSQRDIEILIKLMNQMPNSTLIIAVVSSGILKTLRQQLPIEYQRRIHAIQGHIEYLLSDIPDEGRNIYDD